MFTPSQTHSPFSLFLNPHSAYLNPIYHCPLSSFPSIDRAVYTNVSRVHAKQGRGGGNKGLENEFEYESVQGERGGMCTVLGGHRGMGY